MAKASHTRREAATRREEAAGVLECYAILEDGANVITEFEAKKFRCLKDVKLSLTPLHALIGPNDSGKSTLLLAIKELSTWAERYRWSITERRFPSLGFLPAGPDATLGAKTARGAFLVGPDSFLVTSGAHRWLPGLLVAGDANRDQFMQALEPVLASLCGIQVLRWDAAELRRPSDLIPTGTDLELREGSIPVAGLLDLILSRGDRTFFDISERLAKTFESVQRLRLLNASHQQKEIAIELKDGTQVPASSLSEGILFYLAYEALQIVKKPKVLLIEEPENGLHPARIALVMQMLRKIAEDPNNPTQIIMATHSPLVVNELKPEEVTVVTRDPLTGTKCTPIKDTPNFAERAKAFALGELWLNYANGLDEADLLTKRKTA